MSSSHQLSNLQIAWIVYMSGALAASLALGGMLLFQPEAPPAFEAEHLETNDEGALFRVTSAHGRDGEPLQWDQLETTLTVDPFLDRDGIVQSEDVFFVPSTAPGMIHLVQVALEGKVLWIGAFDAPSADPLAALLDDLLGNAEPQGNVLVVGRPSA